MWRLRRREAGLPSMKGWRGHPREVAPKSTLPRWRKSLQQTYVHTFQETKCHPFRLQLRAEVQ
eukprot:scaffold45626_cov358-Skeletonema_marinoi.AAC.1